MLLHKCRKIIKNRKSDMSIRKMDSIDLDAFSSFVTFNNCVQENFTNLSIEEVRKTSTSLVELKRKWEGVLDDDLLAIVPEHWLQYPPPSTAIHYTLGTLYLIIFLTAIAGNWMIIWLFLTTKSLRTPSNVLITSLAVADFFMNAKMPVFIFNSFAQMPVTGFWGCQTYGFLGGLTGTAAILSVTAMSAERYVIISRPLNPKSRMTSLKALGVTIFIWSYSLTFSIIPMASLKGYVPEGYLTSCSFDYLSDDKPTKIFIFVYFVAAYCLPLLTIIFCYVGIISTVHRSRAFFREDGKGSTMQGPRGSDVAIRKTEIRLAKISFVIIALWLISWTPYATVALIGVTFNRNLLTPLVSMVPALFCKSASVLDPYVYGLTHPRFKAELKKRYPWLMCIKSEQKDVTERSSFRTSMRKMSVSSDESTDDRPIDDFNRTDVPVEQIRMSPIIEENNRGHTVRNDYDDAELPKRPWRSSSFPMYQTSRQSEEVSSDIIMKEIRVYFIPGAVDIIRTDEKVSITFRQSL